MMLSSWDVVEHCTGWRPKALRNQMSEENIEALTVRMLGELVLHREITESQRQQLIARGYGVRDVTYGDIARHFDIDIDRARRMSGRELTIAVRAIRLKRDGRL